MEIIRPEAITRPMRQCERCGVEFEPLRIERDRKRKRTPEQKKRRREIYAAREAITKKAWNEANKARNAATSKVWREANKEYRAAHNREWYKANPEWARASAARHRAAGLSATPPWVDRAELDAIWINCPPGNEVDHLHPLRGPHWRGTLEPGDSLLYLIDLPDDAEDLDGNPISTREFNGLNVPINLWPLESAVNAGKRNKRPAPNLFDWWTPVEAQSREPAKSTDWWPSKDLDIDDINQPAIIPVDHTGNLESLTP
jgi:hypothetical protein